MEITALKKAEKNVKSDNPNLPMDLNFEVSNPVIIKKLLEVNDLTIESDGEKHIIRRLYDEVQRKLSENNYKNITVCRNPPLVSAEDNFDNLMFPLGNPGRSSTYTRYVDENNVLRTHTSAMIPGLFRSYYENLNKGEKILFPTTIIMPGLVYRRDVIDPRHLDVFHQIDVWTLQETKIHGQVNRQDLLSLIETVFSATCPNAEIIIYEAKHPYTIDGLEVYARTDGKDVEVLECGLINPEVLRMAGLDENRFCGLALGMGLERLIMAQKELPDIRLIRSIDPRVVSQMHDLSKYKFVSNQPPIARDMSYSVYKNFTEEDICEEIKIAFEPNSSLIEEVKIIERTRHDDLHPVAINKLGSTPDLDNVLVRIILRHPDVTLTKSDANDIYANSYTKLHKGNADGYPQ